MDNPVGTGYSYVTNDKAYTTDVTMIAKDLVTTFTAFLKEIPDFQVYIYQQLIINIKKWKHNGLLYSWKYFKVNFYQKQDNNFGD